MTHASPPAPATAGPRATTCQSSGDQVVLPCRLDRLVVEDAPVSRDNSSLFPGTLELIALQLLSAEPTNGYDLTLRIQAISRDVLNVNAGSLYPALYRLEAKGLIAAEWAETEN